MLGTAIFVRSTGLFILGHEPLHKDPEYRTCSTALGVMLLRPPTRCFSRGLSTSVTAHSPFRLAVIGSGPAGSYTSHRLLKECPEAMVDMYDSLPVPHGLVRFGVAPDHPEVKVHSDGLEQMHD